MQLFICFTVVLTYALFIKLPTIYTTEVFSEDLLKLPISDENCTTDANVLQSGVITSTTDGKEEEFMLISNVDDATSVLSYHSALLKCHQDQVACSLQDRNTSLKTWCDCATDCGIRGNCCPYDYVNHTLVLRSYPLHEKLSSCETYIVNNRTFDLYVVSKCPKTWNDKDVRMKCENGNSSSQQLVSVHQTIYANKYCANCNDSPDSDVVTWKKVGDGNNMYTAPIQAITGKNMCNKTHIEACYPGVLNDAVIQVCSGFSAPVLDIGTNTTYKNAACAICHNANPLNLMCPQQTDIAFFPLVCKRRIPQSLVPSYSLLIDVNLPSNLDDCEKGAVYDEKRGECRNTHCGALFERQGHRCIARSTLDKFHFQKNLGPFPMLYSCCPKLVLKPDEFVEIDSFSILLTASGKVLTDTEFEVMENNSKILACIDNLIDFENFDRMPVAKYVTLVCCIASVISLTLKITLTFANRRNWTSADQIVLCLAICLLAAQTFYMASFQIRRLPFPFCFSVALFIHYMFLAAFCWTNALSFDLYQSFTPLNQRSIERNLLKMHAYSWSVPAIIVFSTVVIGANFPRTEFDPKYATVQCWFNNSEALLIYFGIPVFLSIAGNGVLFVLCVIRIQRAVKPCGRTLTDMARSATNRLRQRRLFVYLKLALVMGLTWIVGFVAAILNKEWLWCVFVVFNASQGVFILFAFTKIIQEIRRIVKRWQWKTPASTFFTIYTGSTRELRSSHNE